MPVDPDLLEILVCPETRQPVRLASREQIDALNQRVAAGTLRNRGGDPVTKPLEEGLVREDGKILYPVEDSIPVMLVDESIEL
jgi:uncharacterized protein YbaR (Trm112 family)